MKVRVLKHVEIRVPRDKRYYEQLRTEFLLGRKVEHPGLRRSIELKINRSLMHGVTEAALIMELCDGFTLEEFFPEDPTEQVCIFLRAAMAIAALHDYGYVHCDLKPGNIMVHGRAEAMVIDLGQACKIGLTKERIQGTPNFMAPEQTRREPMTIQTDIFCLGATIYQALTKQPMPTLMNVDKSERKALTDDSVPSPKSLVPAITEEMSNLVMECVRLDPEARPADMHQVVERLRDAGLACVRRMEQGDGANFT